MLYKKPELVSLGNSVSAIQSCTGKQNTTTDSTNPPTKTTPAYEADE